MNIKILNTKARRHEVKKVYNKAIFLRVFVSSCLIIFLFFVAQSQEKNTLNIIDTTSLSFFKNEHASVSGSMFLFDEWIEGRINISDGTTLRNCLIKLDLYNDNVLLSTNNKEYIIDKDIVDGFSFDSSALSPAVYYKKIMIGKNDEFLEVILQGKITLYSRKNKVIKQIGNKSINNKQVEEFVDNESYYVSVQSSGIQKLKPNKNSILKLCENKKYDMELFIKSRKIDLNKREDLILLFEYYNRLK